MIFSFYILLKHNEYNTAAPGCLIKSGLTEVPPVSPMAENEYKTIVKGLAYFTFTFILTVFLVPSFNVTSAVTFPVPFFFPVIFPFLFTETTDFLEDL